VQRHHPCVCSSGPNMSNVLLNHQWAIVGFVILRELQLSVDFGFNHRRLFAILTGTFSFKLMLDLNFDIIHIPRWWF
jgi:hypothetical protein